MAYRLMELHVVVADDSGLQNRSFDRLATLEQTKDNEAFTPTIRVAPSDAEVQIPLGTISTGYSIAIYSDYPIRVRLNGVSATQFTMTSNNVQPTNVGAPLPAQCAFVATVQVTSLYVQPIVSAGQTANVWVMCTGDPTNAYT